VGNHFFVIFAVLDVSCAVNSCINHSFFTFIAIMAVSVAVCEIFSVKQWRDLENQVRCRSRSLRKWRCSIDHMRLSIGRLL